MHASINSYECSKANIAFTLLYNSEKTYRHGSVFLWRHCNTLGLCSFRVWMTCVIFAVEILCAFELWPWHRPPPWQRCDVRYVFPVLLLRSCFQLLGPMARSVVLCRRRLGQHRSVCQPATRWRIISRTGHCRTEYARTVKYRWSTSGTGCHHIYASVIVLDN